MYTLSQNNFVSPLDATHPHSSRSSKYGFISTKDVITTFNEQGFEVSSVLYPKVRKPSNLGYNSHIVRMREVNSNYNSSEVPEILIINSHDGTKAFRLGIGFFRFICSNGLIAGDFLADTGRVLHKGNIQDNVLEYISNYSKNVSEKLRTITEMKSIALSNSELQEFTVKAVDIVNPLIKDPSTLLHINRLEDRNSSLWNTFNVVQENAIKGKFQIASTSNGYLRRSYKDTRKARPVNNISRNVEINTKLWNLAESFI